MLAILLIDFFGLIGWMCIANKFQVLSNIYFAAGYVMRSIYLENVFTLFALDNW